MAGSPATAPLVAGDPLTVQDPAVFTVARALTIVLGPGTLQCPTVAFSVVAPVVQSDDVYDVALVIVHETPAGEPHAHVPTPHPRLSVTPV